VDWDAAAAGPADEQLPGVHVDALAQVTALRGGWPVTGTRVTRCRPGNTSRRGVDERDAPALVVLDRRDGHRQVRPSGAQDRCEIGAGRPVSCPAGTMGYVVSATC